MQQSILYYHDERRASDSLELKMNEKNVYLNEGKWKEENMDDICPLIKQWKTEKLWISYNNHPRLISSILEIQFVNLKAISFVDNGVESVEEISRIWMPCLEGMAISNFCPEIDNNNIIFLKSLKKANWNRFERLALSNNKLQQGAALCLHSSIRLEKLIVEFNEGSKEQFSDIRWVVKLRTKFLKQLTKKSSDRITSQPLEKVIKKKYILQ